MNIQKSAARLLLLLAALAAPAFALAADGAAPASLQGTQYTPKGADTCLECHDDSDVSATFSYHAVFKGAHGRRNDPRTPFGPGGLQCEACHGPGAAHIAKGSKKALTIDNFKRDSVYSVEYRNQACLACHQNGERTAWHEGAHEKAGVACTDCHSIHRERDAALNKKTEAEVCYRCHKQQRADFDKPSAHPVREGKIACSDCHNPHGTGNPTLLRTATVNQTCTSCHAEKRGPLLWEHEPVSENCTLCHKPHGSVHDDLLVQTPPLLCQQCHALAGHPSVAPSGALLPAGSAGASPYMLAGACTNCHSQVHGSNHPSGSNLLR